MSAQFTLTLTQAESEYLLEIIAAASTGIGLSQESQKFAYGLHDKIKNPPAEKPVSVTYLRKSIYELCKDEEWFLSVGVFFPSKVGEESHLIVRCHQPPPAEERQMIELLAAPVKVEFEL